MSLARAGVWIFFAVVVEVCGPAQIAHAQGTAPENCALNANGVMVCLGEPGSSSVNNNPVTQNPNNCGYVNGIYGCFTNQGSVIPSSGTPSDPGTDTPATTPNEPDSGATQNCGFGDFGCQLSAFAAWLSDKLLYVPRKCFEWFMEALGNLIVAVPAPQFVTDAKNALGNIPSAVLWFLNIMQFKFGLVTMLTAYSLKFLMRIVPFFV